MMPPSPYTDSPSDSQARQPENGEHRPHAAWHEYRDAGVYLITIVIKNRRRCLFGELNRDAHRPAVLLTKLGQEIEKQWQMTEDLQHKRGREIRSLAHVVMPDHFHAVVEVMKEMDVSIGQVIRDFKSACTTAYRTLYHQPSMADVEKKDAARMSHSQREQYYAALGIEALWEDNFDDTICLGLNHRDNAIRYVQDNPHRAVIRCLRPQFFEYRQHIRIAGQDYSAFGNLFLLRRPWKEQVFCHRWLIRDNGSRDYDHPYETTEAFRFQRTELLHAAQEGAVLVTPGISKGEQMLVQDCMEQGFPLIHLQDRPMYEHWKPEEQRFALCKEGLLLILAPWALEKCGEVDGVPGNTTYSRFHNMNDLAKTLCGNDYLEMKIL